MRIARGLTVSMALLALLLLVLSGPGTRQGWWEWRTGLTMYQWAAYVGIASALASAVLVLLLAVPRWRVRPWLPVVSLCLALAAITAPLIMKARVGSVPPIHDITTDAADPPAFVALLPQRQMAPNGAAYGGPEVARQQAAAYPDIKPKVIAKPPAEAVQSAIDAARALGWQIVATDTASGRIEATDTTRWFGFKDDVVIRIRPEGAGSRVDVRSVSRVGRSDVGANAARVREFLAKLA